MQVFVFFPKIVHTIKKSLWEGARALKKKKKINIWFTAARVTAVCYNETRTPYTPQFVLNTACNFFLPKSFWRVPELRILMQLLLRRIEDCKKAYSLLAYSSCCKKASSSPSSTCYTASQFRVQSKNVFRGRNCCQLNRELKSKN